MKVNDIITEEHANYYGIVVSTEKATKKFEDADLIDFGSDNFLGHRPSHAKNMFDHIILVLRETNGWNQLEPFLAKNSRQQVPLGPEFSDDENFTNIKYGPYTADELGHLGDALAEELGHEEEPWD